MPCTSLLFKTSAFLQLLLLYPEDFKKKVIGFLDFQSQSFSMVATPARNGFYVPQSWISTPILIHALM